MKKTLPEHFQVINGNPYGDALMEDVLPSEDDEYSLLKFSTTGISDENKINDISIYPNPSEGIITIGNLTGFQNLSGLLALSQTLIYNNKENTDNTD